MKKSPDKDKRNNGPSTKAGKAKKVAPSSATGGKGYRFENRVQATKLLAMCIGCPTAGLLDDSRVVELRFQARVHDRFTDDLVCTVENSAGQRSRALMQMKSGLLARKSDVNFTQAVGNAWLDFQSADFTKHADVLLIVHDMATKIQMRGAEAVATMARSSLTSSDWLQKLLAPGAGNEAKRNAYAVIKSAVDLYAKCDSSPDELHGFLVHVYFLAHDLDSDTTAECKSYLYQIQTAAPGHPVRQNPPLVWSKLVTICMELNEQAGAVDLTNLRAFIGDELSNWFGAHRLLFGAGSQAMATLLPGHQTVAPSNVSLSIGTTVQVLVAPGLQEQLPTARESSANKLLSGQLDHINTKIKTNQFTSALADIDHLGLDQTLFDAHQKARWHLLRGICYWHLHGEEDAASEFIKAADLCEDDDKLAASRARAHLLRKEIPQAISAAQAAVDRFPNSLSAWLILANAEMIDGKALIESDIPPVHRAQADALQIVAWSLRANGKGAEAAKTALKALSLSGAGFFLADACLSLTLENAAGDGLMAAFRLFDDSVRNDLAIAVAAFEPRVQKLWAVQAPDTVVDTAARLGMAYLLLGKPEDALSVYQESEARALQAPVLYRLGIEALAASGKKQDALSLGKRAVDRMPPEAMVAFGQLASNVGDVESIEKALYAAKERVLEQRTIDALQALRWDTMLDQLETRPAALDEIRQQLGAVVSGNTISLLAISGRALTLYGKPREADQVVERAIGLINENSDAGEIYLVSMLLMQARRYALAAELLDRILPKNQLSELHVHRLRALLRSGQLAKARHLVRSFPPGWAFNDDARHIAIDLGQRTADWEFLARLVEPQINRHPNAAVSWNFKFYVAVHRDEAGIRAIIGDAPELVTGSTDELARLASTEMAYGDRDKAVRRLYRMRREKLDDAEAAAVHLAAHLMQGDPLPLLHAVPDTVGPGTSVLLRDSVGQEMVRTIDPSDCQVFPLTEEFRHANFEDVRRIIGLRVGESLVITEKLTSQVRTYQVMQIQSAYRRLLDLSGRATSQSLNPSKIVTMMSIGKDSEGKTDFSELTRQLKEQSDHAHQVFEIYRTTPITLGGVAKMLGRDVIELARGWQQQDVPLFVGGGVLQEREAAGRLFAELDSRFVIDAATLAELATIECLDCLANLPQILVTTRTRDLITHKLANMRITRQQGTAFQQDGKLGFSEFRDQDRIREVRYFEAIVSAIDRYCDVLPAYGPNDISKVPAELHRMLSAEEFSVLLLCLQESAHFLTIDGRLRNIAALLGAQGVWPQALLLHTRLHGQISDRDYSVACLKMFLSNRSFISLGDIDLAMLAYQGENWLDSGIRKFAKHIAAGEIDFESALRVGMQFLGVLFRQGNCQLGVISQLLAILVAALRNHQHCVKDLRVHVQQLLATHLGPLSENHPEYLRLLVNTAFSAGSNAKIDLPLSVAILKIASPPLIIVRAESAGTVQTDSKLSPLTESPIAQTNNSTGVGTSAAIDARSEQI